VIRSMTGFASVGRETSDGIVQVTAKSVNHRFLDVALKAPASLGVLEARIRAIVQQRVARGRVELTLAAEVAAPAEREVVLDEALLTQVAAVLDRARERGIISGGLTASDLLRIPQAFEIRVRSSGAAPSGLSGAAEALVETAVADAIDALVVMRETEGRLLGADLADRLLTIQAFVDRLAVESEHGQQHLEASLRERLDLLPPDLHGDPASIAREVVRFVARSDIDEELVRMRSHIEHWRVLAGGPEPCGRKLDFLVQEMNREINTIGSKVESARATETVIAAKAELERIREQVQNVE